MPSPVKLPVKVEEVIFHTDDLFTVRLSSERKLPRFRPGQFLHLALDRFNPESYWPESRVFSIASSPLERNSLEIVLSVKGNFTNRMRTELKSEKGIWIKLPYGNFFFPKKDAHVVLIAGGTGITPYLSYLSYSLVEGLSCPVRLYYGIRESAQYFPTVLLTQCREELPELKQSLFVERGAGPEGRQYEAGQIDIEKVYKENNQQGNEVYYLSGPSLMIKQFHEFLTKHDIPEERISVDEWV